jgi:hypothetical protein
LTYSSPKVAAKRVVVWCVDRVNFRLVKLPMYTSADWPTEKVLEACKKSVAVGDYLVFEETKEAYKRVRGGWKKCGLEDMAELVAFGFQEET